MLRVTELEKQVRILAEVSKVIIDSLPPGFKRKVELNEWLNNAIYKR